MSDGEATRGRVESLLALLGDGADEVVLVGGCAPAFYDLAAFVGDIRPTEDVDLLVEGGTCSAYQASVKRIAARANLAPDQTPGAPICRLRRDDLVVDVMPARGEFLGFTNRWYGDAWSSALVVRTASGRDVRVDVALRRGGRRTALRSRNTSRIGVPSKPNVSRSRFSR